VKDTLVIIQRFSVLIIFFTVFYCTYKKTLSYKNLLVIDSINIGVVGVVFILSETRSQWHCGTEINRHPISRICSLLYDSLSKTLIRLVVLTAILFAFSPVLGTLTSLYSNDTICALTFLLTGIHLAFHDYNYIANAHSNPPPRFEGTISLNAAIFLSVLLASRLSTDMSVFAFMLFAFQVHGGFPVISHHIRRYSELLHSAISLLSCGLCLYLLHITKPLFALLYSLAILLICFVCPYWFKKYQRYKAGIHGPWDYDDEKEWASDNW